MIALSEKNPVRQFRKGPNDQWHTVVNGLFAGLTRGTFASRALSRVSSFGQKAGPQISVVGFAHTHPRGLGNTADPSEWDWVMRRAGNMVGIDIFPIVWYNGVRNRINWDWKPDGNSGYNDIAEGIF